MCLLRRWGLIISAPQCGLECQMSFWTLSFLKDEGFWSGFRVTCSFTLKDSSLQERESVLFCHSSAYEPLRQGTAICKELSDLPGRLTSPLQPQLNFVTIPKPWLPVLLPAWVPWQKLLWLCPDSWSVDIKITKVRHLLGLVNQWFHGWLTGTWMPQGQLCQWKVQSSIGDYTWKLSTRYSLPSLRGCLCDLRGKG